MSMLEEVATPDISAANPEIKPSKKPVSRFRLVLSRLRSTPRFWVGIIGLGLISLWAIFGLVPNAWNYTDLDVLNMGASPSSLHWFGTSDIGEDIYAQTIVGLRKSLIIGLLVGPWRPSSPVSWAPSPVTSVAGGTRPSSGSSTSCWSCRACSSSSCSAAFSSRCPGLR
ncbi:hypothetical protein [Arthrobacter psychrolactophilus]